MQTEICPIDVLGDDIQFNRAMNESGVHDKREYSTRWEMTMAFPVRGTPNPGVNSFKKTMYFTEEVIDYSGVCYSNAMSYTIQWQEMSSK